MYSVIASLTSAEGADFSFDYNLGYPPVVNNAEIAKLVANAAKKIVGDDNVVENFHACGRFFLLRFNLGCRHPHDENNLDESCIITGIQILSQCVLDFLG